MKHPIATMTPENRVKLDKFILSKLKSNAPLVIKGVFGEGEIHIVKSRVQANPWGAELYLKVKYVEKTSSDRSWLSKNTIGRRRNDRIKDEIVWRHNNFVRMIAKPFGINNITIESVTVKK